MIAHVVNWRSLNNDDETPKIMVELEKQKNELEVGDKNVVYMKIY